MKDTTQAKGARRHSLPTTIGGYENLLVSMIEARTGDVCDAFLMPQITACAQTWMMLNRVHKDLMKEKRLTDYVQGSKNQYKNEVNPLLPYYLKLQAELRLQFEALGLNFRSKPQNIKEDAKRGVNTERDGLANMLSNVQAGMVDVPEM